MTQDDAYRNISGDQRITAGCELHDFAFDHIMTFLRTKNPLLTERELVLETAKRFLGDAAPIFQ
jgi:hypothetical protein